MADYTEENWPLGYALFFTRSSRAREFADTMTIFSYMKYGEMEPWKDSFNTVSAVSSRGEGYEEFKKRKAEKLMIQWRRNFPVSVIVFNHTIPLRLVLS
ncbi:MAG: hypothetical protein WDO19_07200 [Bacteroidota bacterium]